MGATDERWKTRIGRVSRGLPLFGPHSFKLEHVLLLSAAHILRWLVDSLKHQHAHGWNVSLKVHKGSVHHCVDNSDIPLGTCLHVIGGERGSTISPSIPWRQHCYVPTVTPVSIITKVYRVASYEPIRRGEDHGNQRHVRIVGRDLNINALHLVCAVYGSALLLDQFPHCLVVHHTHHDFFSQEWRITWWDMKANELLNFWS